MAPSHLITDALNVYLLLSELITGRTQKHNSVQGKVKSTQSKVVTQRVSHKVKGIQKSAGKGQSQNTPNYS